MSSDKIDRVYPDCTYPIKTVDQVLFPFPASLCSLSVLFAATFLSFKVNTLWKEQNDISMILCILKLSRSAAMSSAILNDDLWSKRFF